MDGYGLYTLMCYQIFVGFMVVLCCVWFQGKIFPSHPGFGFYMYGAAAAAAAAAGGGDGGSETAYPPPAHMGIQPLYVDSKAAGKFPSQVHCANTSTPAMFSTRGRVCTQPQPLTSLL